MLRRRRSFIGRVRNMRRSAGGVGPATLRAPLPVPVVLHGAYEEANGTDANQLPHLPGRGEGRDAHLPRWLGGRGGCRWQ